MINLWNRSVMRWIAPLTVVAIGGCPLDPETVGNEQEGGGTAESSSTADDVSASGAESSGESGSAESSDPESGGSETAGSEGAETSVDTTDGELSLGCADPQPILQFDDVTPTGFERCADGFVHRAEAVTCVLPEAPATCDSGDTGNDSCSSSAECTEKPNGHCIDDSFIIDGCGCVYSCETDADCETGEICACTGVTGDVPRCVPAGCEDTGACGDGLCGLSTVEFQCGNIEYELGCLDAQSECRVDECAPEQACDNVDEDPVVPPCELVEGLWTCNQNANSLCGDCG
jgi:hypothetical protein